MKPLACSAFALAVVSAALSSCSTARGFGQDLQKVGNQLENQAESTGGTAPPPATTTTRTTRTVVVPPPRVDPAPVTPYY